MSLQDTLSAFLVQAKDAGCQRLLVAYSGGVDSHVLLFQLNELNKGDFSIPLDAIYINHNLQPKALEWGEHCQNICQSLNIPFKQIDVQAKPETGESPEEKARTARYQAFSDELQSNHWLVTAQHLDDQAETFLLQLLRGSGVDGLSAMPSQRNLGKGCHHRPFLSISRQQIEQCAKDHDLKWVEDPTNQDRGVPRNYLRQNVLPAFKGKWPETALMVSRSAGWLAESAAIMEDVAKQDLASCLGEQALGQQALGQQSALKISEMAKLTSVRQKNLIRYWFHSLKLQRPGNEKLALIFEQIIHARLDANPSMDWQDTRIKRYAGQLYICPQWPDLNTQWQLDWDGQSSINLHHDWAVLSSTLCSNEVKGKGLSQRFLLQPLRLQLRKGGEHCQPVERDKSRSLKKLFQEYEIPPWLRSRWPLLYCNEQLVAVPGLFVCKGFEATGDELGLEFTLQGSEANRS